MRFAAQHRTGAEIMPLRSSALSEGKALGQICPVPDIVRRKWPGRYPRIMKRKGDMEIWVPGPAVWFRLA